ncbi:type IV conjugative transfer system protein TraL [Duganella vulcania]|uniref:Type IV conjugative transfer system protein TraL n=1 Tax=Duganella vulcania TaxID=2692166 RepID=A0A845GI36_9BURK|nr:type IV conjugative transfer system protein TraL [Duganella vulcania]
MSKRIPNYIDDPQQIFVWSADEFVPVAGLMAIGFLSGQLTIMLVVLYVVLKVYRRYRDGNPNGHILHLLFWFGIVSSKKARTFKNGFVRSYIP